MSDKPKSEDTPLTPIPEPQTAEPKAPIQAEPSTPEPQSAPHDQAASDAQEAIKAKTPKSTPLPNSEAPPIVNSTSSQNAKPKGIGLIAVLLVLGWAATGGAGYWYATQQHAQTTALQNTLAQVQSQVVEDVKNQQYAQQETLNQFEQRVNAELKTIEREATGDVRKLASQIKEHEERLNGQQERIAGLSTTSREDWLLAEAEYLLKLANQRVLLERTPQNVVALLTRADDIMERVSAGLGDRELFAIRSLLAEEITALKLVEAIDTQGLYLTLESLANAINTLPTLPSLEERFTKTPEAPQENNNALTQFKHEMANVIAFFTNSFSLRAQEELANPIVTQQHLQLMQLNTRLLIEQAQIALLKEDNTSYQASLKSASHLVSQYYFESPARTAFATQLNDLANKNIAQELPDISRSLKLLHAYIASQHKLNAPTAGATQGVQ